MQSRKSRPEADERQLVLDWEDESSCSTVQQTVSTAGTSTHDAWEPVAAVFSEERPLVREPTPAPPSFPAPITVLTGLQHPCANRQIVLDSHALGYWLKRGRRRTVGMRVTTQGLEVSAPGWVRLEEIDRILHDKSGWIVRKLEDQARINREQQQARPQWLNGQYLPWRGGLLQLQLEGGPQTEAEHMTLSPARLRRLAAAARLLPSDTVLATTILKEPVAQRLLLDLPANSRGEVIRDCTAHWMQQQALNLFTERLDHYAPQLEVNWQALRLSQANGRWGSANSRGVIRLHWRLVQLAPEVLDYVAVHELAHLREMNHGRRFWALVEQILPDYQQRRFQLMQTTLTPW